MKVIFLDIDGCLNSDKFINEIRATSAIKYSPNHWIDPKAVERLNKITDITGAKIVISSSWRLDFPSVKLISDHLKKFGITGDIIGITKYLGEKRGEEIKLYLDENKDKNIENFVIIDDINEFPGLEEHFVQTDVEYGLLDNDVKKARLILHDFFKKDVFTFTSVSIDYNNKIVILSSILDRTYNIPFDWFSKGYNKIYFYNPSIIDDGLTINFGDFEVASDAILYDFDPQYKEYMDLNQLD